MRYLRYLVLMVVVMGMGVLSVHAFLRVYSKNNRIANMAMAANRTAMAANSTAIANANSTAMAANSTANPTANSTAMAANSAAKMNDNGMPVSAFTHAQNMVITIFDEDSNFYVNSSALPLHPQKTIKAKWVNNIMLVSPFTLLEVLGANYQYQATSKRLDVDFAGKRYTFAGGSPLIQIDTQQKMMPVASLLDQQELLIPIIYVIQAMNPSIDNRMKRMTITKAGTIEGVQRLQELYQTVPTIQRYSQIPFALHHMEQSF